MRLTGEEKGMRDGAEGAAVAAAIDLLIRYGEALGAEHLCDVRNVATSMTQPSPTARWWPCMTRPSPSPRARR